ncbi:hypothetical protein ACBT_0887 [Aliarcobacter cibarius]|uniref:Resolvase n=1 Tax=Aliarcobacter cibarius TaxID=255507 RepID=A0A7L5JNR0_9BACT|nr:hypothetical protein [Aliarcobacter cibarius]QKJ26807.1 hypothetical protein ACBT_0887 [Aliarcobacter cibarius]
MSITNVSKITKQLVLLRLINSGESLEDASSKAGLSIKLSKNYLNIK